MGLTNRELASIILFVVFVVVMLLVPKTRVEVGPSVLSVLKVLLVRSILVSLVGYLVYAAAIVFVGWKLSVWNVELLKDTIILVFFVGLPLAASAHELNEGSKLVGRVIRDTVGISALLLFYLNLEFLPLLGELLVQPIILFCVLMAIAAQREQKTKGIATFFNVLAVLVILCLLVLGTIHLIKKWDTYDWPQVIDSFALSIWLPIALIPFVYVFAFFMHCQLILKMLPCFNEKKVPRLRIRLALVLGLHFSTRFASLFTGKWRGEIARTDTFRGGRRVMRKFRRNVRNCAKAEEQRLARLDENAGTDGVDEDGLLLDRREFGATKKVLTRLFQMEMGWYRNQLGHYREDMLVVLGDVTKDGLPADNGIQLKVRKDKQAWRAWRQTLSGWYFGVGGTPDLNYMWQYEGFEPPDSFPIDNDPWWVNASVRESSAEWSKDDEPIRAS